MKSCLRIPRLFLPEDGFEGWAALPCDLADGKERGGLSVRSLSPADCTLGETDPEKLREDMYAALAADAITRLWRGMVLVKRTGARGERRGLVAQADLEEYSADGGKTAIRATAETDPALVAARLRERENAILEFPHTVLCFRDKKNKIFRALDEDELEKLYDFSPRAGERLEGFFIPDYIAREVLDDVHHCPDFLGVLDGNHTLAAAKAHWERVKKGFTPNERRNHPARFALAELVNFYDPAVAVQTKEGAEVPKEELLSHWKSGKRYPVKALRLAQPRYELEAREISYD